MGNLMLTRKQRESIVVDGPAKITVMQMKNGQVRLSVNAPATTRVVRGEIPPLKPNHPPRTIKRRKGKAA